MKRWIALLLASMLAFWQAPVAQGRTQPGSTWTGRALVTALLGQQLRLVSFAGDKVTEDASFAEDLEADSLDLVELVMAIEDNLDVTIEEDQLADVKTVRDALNVIVAASTAAA